MGSGSSRACSITPWVNMHALILKHSPNPNQDAFFRFRPGCELRIEPARPACQANEAPTHVPRRPPTGGIVNSFWAMRRVTRTNCGTLSKTARVGRRTWTRATPRDATRRLRPCSRIAARRVEICASALPAVSGGPAVETTYRRTTTSVLRTALFDEACSVLPPLISRFAWRSYPAELAARGSHCSPIAIR